MLLSTWHTRCDESLPEGRCSFRSQRRGHNHHRLHHSIHIAWREAQMAIDAAPRTEYEQRYLDALDVERDIATGRSGYAMPEVRMLDPEDIEIIVDLDLDEMLLYFFGRHVAHDVEPQSDLVSYLVAPDSDNVVGVIVHEFMSRAVKQYPQLAEAMRWAIIVSGNAIQSPSRDVGRKARESKGHYLLRRLHARFLERLSAEGRERTAETVQALLRGA